VDSETPTILEVDPGRAPDANLTGRVIDALRAGDLVVLPTETVYGLAADPAQPAAMERLYSAKGRPDNKPIAFLGTDADSFQALGVKFSPKATALAKRFWPGPLTIVAPSPDGDTGCRVPDHPVTLAILSAFGRPLAVTSANLSGQASPRTAGEAVDQLGQAVRIVVDAGPAVGGTPSTVIAVREDAIEILREGAIPAAHIAEG